MKYLKLSLFLLIALAFSACAPKANLVIENTDKREPIPHDGKVKIAFATDIPVIPENSVSIATMATNPETHCSEEAALEFLIDTARELGANFLYLKRRDGIRIVNSYGLYSTKDCVSIYADFLEVK